MRNTPDNGQEGPRSLGLTGVPSNRGFIVLLRLGRVSARAVVPIEDSGCSLLRSADVWHNVKKHWCIEAQRLIRVRRVALVGS